MQQKNASSATGKTIAFLAGVSLFSLDFYFFIRNGYPVAREDRDKGKTQIMQNPTNAVHS